jgi:hypothetical protein
MADGTSSAAVQAAGVQKLETIELPGFGGSKSSGPMDVTKYSVKYAKIDLDDAGSRAELEILETRGLKGESTIVLSKDKFVFMDKYFIVVTYLELNVNA